MAHRRVERLPPPQLRTHDFTVDGDTRAALRLLAQPWVHHSASAVQLEVRVADGRVVRVAVDVRDVEPRFECFRLAAAVGGTHAMRGSDSAFVGGAARVTVLRGEDWIEAPVVAAADSPPDREPTLGLIDAPGSRPWNAESVCVVDDGLLLESAAGERLLAYCAWPPCTLTVTRHPRHIDEFCAARARVELTTSDA